MSESFSHFALRPASREALAARGITRPTPIQSAAIGPLLAGRDVIGQARTGSGKTLAFALPLLERISQTAGGVQALVLVPTRELAVQVAGVVEELAGPSGPRVALLYGGKPLGQQIAALRAGARIVVGTPGRTLDHLRQGSLRLREVRYLVLDEADEMLDRGFAPDVERILDHAPRERQTALFSATIADWVHAIAARHLQDPLVVRIDASPSQAAPSIDQVVYEVPNGQKLAVLETLLDRRGDGSVLVFGRTKHGVKKLGAKLAAKGFPAATLQGNLSQNARDRAMAEFRAGRLPILVATNVAARGIDVSDVERVINYELPESAELFTHRIGRTGRMGRAGEAITLVSPAEADQWQKLERQLGRRLPRRVWDEPLDGPPDPSELAQVRRAGGRASRPSPRPARPRAEPRAPLKSSSQVADRPNGASQRSGRPAEPGRSAGRPGQPPHRAIGGAASTDGTRTDPNQRNSGRPTRPRPAVEAQVPRAAERRRYRQPRRAAPSAS